MLNRSSYQVELPVFEGPLDLLLRLIEREELDITTVALAQVTGQYLSYLSEIEEKRGSDLAAFLMVAAKLLLIKSRALLPQPPTLSVSDEDVGDDLMYQLQIYKQFKEIAQHLRSREETGLRSYVRIARRPLTEPRLDLSGVTLDDLVVAARQAMETLPADPVGHVVTPVAVTIKQQIERIQSCLATSRRVRFREVLSSAASRVEIIVTLLALLELIKRDKVRVWQERLFGAILIEPRKNGGPDADGVPATQATA
jgi:segregation and condensation protein A